MFFLSARNKKKKVHIQDMSISKIKNENDIKNIKDIMTVEDSGSKG